ncbi:MAG: hybrid sensor histidine kinase/response regulator [Gammaproteobacteria bacterium]|jgi:two-component system sensor kinase FixL|nr:hybrid sensor histidine kinase/response regulator [Gammaproteobacteria bacterium]
MEKRYLDNHYQLLLQGVELIRDYAIFVLDPAGYIMTWNLGAQRIKGYTAKEIIGQHFSRFYDEEARKSHYPQKELVFAKAQGRFEDEGWRIRKDGTKFWVNVIISVVHDAQGELIGFSKVTRDLTERKQAELALQASKERLDLALDIAQMVGVWEWDFTKKTLHADKRTYELFGLESSTFLINYDNLFAYVYATDRIKLQQQIMKAIEHHLPYELEFRVTWPDKSIHLLSSRGRVYYDEKTGKSSRLLNVCWDITQHKHAEDWIQRYQLELAQVARISSMTEMASSLAHELNQPLTVISTYTQLCLEYLETGRYHKEQLLESIQEAVKQSKRAGDILHRIKDLVSKRKLHLERCHMNQLVEESTVLLRYEFPDYKINFQLNLAELTQPLLFDKTQLQQVLLNLLRNSVEAVRDANRLSADITIESRFIEGKQLLMAIKDNGPGIPEEVVAKILDPYFTTKPYGMGMGLTICRTIIKAHGGQLIVTQSESEKTHIQFTLPLDQEVIGVNVFD